VALSDVNSVLVERYTYDVFGRPAIRDANGTEIAASAFANPYLFTGRAYDAETGLYYYRARYYDYATGRFLQPDPTGYTDGLNLYAYVRNNPANCLDPLGLKIIARGEDWPLVYKTLAYLSTAGPEAQQFIEYLLTTDEITIEIRTNTLDVQGASAFVPAPFEPPYVIWNPYLGGETANGELSSPAVVLFHEIIHNIDWLKNGTITMDNAAIIAQLEGPMLKGLGEDVRTTDNGFMYPVITPFSTTTDWERVTKAYLLDLLRFWWNQCLSLQACKGSDR
jgi:RHS repeat-associated protein